MSKNSLEADYVIVGAGAVGMAFADTLLTDSDASMIMVDRRHKPGGHWNDAYPFVRLHAPSAYYGVNSSALGSGRIEETGLNRGLFELATGAEICAYFDRVMHERLIPSGRMTYLPMSDFADAGTVVSRIDGTRVEVEALRKVVHATHADTRLPATHGPSFFVSPDVRCASPNALVHVNEPYKGFVVIGAGKTAMDTVIWLLEQRVDLASITWIRPRSLVAEPPNLQRSFDFFAETFGAFASEMEAARDASSIEGLFARLEAADLLMRIDTSVTPTMYRCAIVSHAELEALRSVRNVVRLGRITSISRDEIVLERGVAPTSPDNIHIHCSADGIPPTPPEPIFQPDRIVLQYVRRCSPTFSGAFIAHLEATLSDDAAKNALATPVPAPREPLDWLRMQLHDARHRLLWAKLPELQHWLGGARLDGFTALTNRAHEERLPEHMAALERFRSAVGPGLARLAELLKEAERVSAAHGFRRC